MGYSRLEYPFTGGEQTFVANFALGYLDASDVHAYIKDDIDGLGSTVFQAFTWVDDNTIRVTNTLPVPCILVIDRTVSKSALVLDVNGAGDFTRETLIIGFKQLMMSLHELLDGRVKDFTDASLILGYIDLALAAANAAQVSEFSAAASALLTNGYVAAAATSAATADAEATAANASRVSAATSRTQADLAKVAADASALAADASKVSSAASATTSIAKAAEALASALAAYSSKVAADASAALSATKAADAASSALAADTSRIATAALISSATASADASELSALDALASEAAAAASAALAAASLAGVLTPASVTAYPYFSVNDATKWARFNGTNGALATQTISDNPLYPSGKRITFDVAADQQVSVRTDSTDAQWLGVKGAFAYHVTVDFEPISGGILSAGVYLQYVGTSTQNVALSLSKMSASRAVENGVKNRACGVMAMPAAFIGGFTANNLYVMANHSAFGETLTAKSIAFDSCYIRPATDVEIANGGITRAAMANMIARGYVPVPGLVYTLDGLRYTGVAGSTGVADLPGLFPVQPAYPEHWGAVGNGVADDTAKVIAAVTSGLPQIFASNKKYRLTNRVTLTDVQLVGAGYDFVSMSVSSMSSLTGSVFICDFLPATAESMFYLGRNGRIKGLLGYFNRQTATRPSNWVPVVSPWFVISGEFASPAERSGAEDVMFLEFTHGLRLRGNGGARGNFSRVHGNPLTRGLEADGNYDVTRFTDFHFWPYGGNTGAWQLNERVWTLNNLIAYRFGRVDGLLLHGCFTIGAAVSLDFYPSENTVQLLGSATTNFHATDCYLDGGNTSLRISGTYAVEHRVSGHMIGCTMQHWDSADEEIVTEAENVVITSDFKEIAMVGCRLGANGGQRRGSLGRVNAPYGVLHMTGCSGTQWDAGAINAPAFTQSGAASRVDLGDMKFFAANQTPMNLAGKVISAGRVTVTTPQIAWTPTMSFVTPGNLSIVYGGTSGLYRIHGDVMDIKCRLVATPTFTTASGALRIGGFPVLPGLSTTPTEFGIGFITNVSLGTRYEVAGRYTPGNTYIDVFLTGGTAVTLDASSIVSGNAVNLLFEASIWL